MPAAIEWRPVTLVKCFVGSGETLAAIQLKSRRNNGRCCAPHSSHPVTSWERRTTSPYEIRAATDEECLAGRVMKRLLQGRMSMWASLCPPVCPSTVSLPLDLSLRVLKRVTVWHHLETHKKFQALSYNTDVMRGGFPSYIAPPASNVIIAVLKKKIHFQQFYRSQFWRYTIAFFFAFGSLFMPPSNLLVNFFSISYCCTLPVDFLKTLIFYLFLNEFDVQ